MFPVKGPGHAADVEGRAVRGDPAGPPGRHDDAGAGAQVQRRLADGPQGSGLGLAGAAQAAAAAAVGAVAIASNKSFGGWTKTFTDPRLCAAIVDRLTFNGTIIETGTDSYRLASTRARAEQPAKAV
ncbi:hypothetical protein GCM10018785_66220 [Streptomyces longispororuber]|uniref:IstB-like ATP-binding domain-containing protein n=1 Tax=Streptomyces longispororuber TaxID=68230 RepID=A0A919DXB6_9ACTN|nr:hypothetical protein GCM10018785_66220 [Streptomyces longispororuber]